MSEGKKTYPNRDARSHNEPIRLEKIEKDVRELKNQVEVISKEVDVLKTDDDAELVNLPESIEPHAARAEGEDDEDKHDEDPDPEMTKGRRGLWAAIVRLFNKLFGRSRPRAEGEDDEDKHDEDPDPD